MEKYFSLTECLGYLASLVILISFLMRNIRYLRIINFIGCGLFVTYGLLIDSWPVVISNVAIACIHAVYLAQMRAKKER